METKEPLLRVKQFSVSFTQYTRGMRQRELRAIRDLDLSVCPGQVVAVVGASGSGKSLLAHGILGLLPYNARISGDILYEGRALTSKRLRVLRGREIVLVPQGVGGLDPLMRVGRQIECTGRVCAARALERLGLDGKAARAYPFMLSGGMARRALMAAAVTEDAKLVVADEPTPGLDREAAARVLGRFRDVADKGAAVLLITHDLESALSVADSVAVLYAGVTVEQAPAKDFATEQTLRHPYTRALWRAMPEHGFASEPGVQPSPGASVTGCAFAPRCPCREPDCLRETSPFRAVRGGFVRCRRA